MSDKIKFLKSVGDGVAVDLQKVGFYYKDMNSFGVQNRLLMLMRKYSSMAILKFLVEGDRYAFFECCFNSAVCFDVHNIFCKCGMPHDRMSYSLTDSVGLFSGILAIGSEMAGNLAWGVHSKCRYGEDEFTFWFAYGLFGFMFDDEDDALKRYIEILKEFRDEGREADIEIGIYEGLFNKDQDTFVNAMTAYLERREVQIANKEEIQIGEESICIEALGLIRLAQDLGINVIINHRLTPAELQRDYPETSSYKRAAPVINDAEVDDPEFWKDWSPVGNVL